MQEQDVCMLKLPRMFALLLLLNQFSAMSFIYDQNYICSNVNSQHLFVCIQCITHAYKLAHPVVKSLKISFCGICGLVLQSIYQLHGPHLLIFCTSLESAGILRQLANYLDANIPNADLIASAIGVASAIIDNVPLVAATMGMYDLTSFPQDADFWQLVAFCAGTGGSMLIIGSAAGVAFMGMEKVDFFWYFRKVN